jgi:hypothetical protein
MRNRSNTKIEYVSAAFLTSRNCEVVIGRPWDAINAIAREAGIAAVMQGRVKHYPADRIIAAILAQAAKTAPVTESEQADALLAEIGFEVRQ